VDILSLDAGLNFDELWKQLQELEAMAPKGSVADVVVPLCRRAGAIVSLSVCSSYTPVPDTAKHTLGLLDSIGSFR
jgi:hypothetical protein